MAPIYEGTWRWVIQGNDVHRIDDGLFGGDSEGMIDHSVSTLMHRALSHIHECKGKLQVTGKHDRTFEHYTGPSQRLLHGLQCRCLDGCSASIELRCISPDHRG